MASFVTVQVHIPVPDPDYPDPFPIAPSLGYRGEHDFTLHFSFDILLRGVAIGSIKLILLDRSQCGGAFHAACDAESRELQGFGCKLFKKNGRPKYPTLKKDPSVANGGFVYIESLLLKEEHRQGGNTDVASAGNSNVVVRALLSS